MKNKQRLNVSLLTLAALGAALSSCMTKETSRHPAGAKPHVSTLVTRYWELEVDPAQFDAFKEAGAENLETSAQAEPGVLMMHAVQLASNPAQVRVLEVYADQAAYEAHIASPHFRKYRAASAAMVTSNRLIEITPIALCAKDGASAQANAPGAMVRIAELNIDPAYLDDYKARLVEEQEASVRLELGVLMLHSFQYSQDPTQVRLLEVYANRDAYEAHIRSPHFLKYKVGTEKMVRSLELVPVSPVKLASQTRPLGITSSAQCDPR